MKIAIGCDHAGFELKEKVVDYLKEKHFNLDDVGTFSSESVDYPDYAHLVGKKVNDREAIFGIVICGSANGVNMVVNKYLNVRSALCWKKEIAVLARQHNDANILALPARYLTWDEAKEIVDAFFFTMFEGGRHATRVEKIKNVI